MTIRKYITEFALVTTGAFKMLLQQDQLESIKNFSFGNYPCHIYMITRRPRIMLDPESVRFYGDRVSGKINIQKGTSLKSRGFDVPNYIGTSNLEIKCPYPHTEYTVFDNKGERVAGGKTALLVSTFGGFEDILPLEVIYIGQSFGLGGNRTAIERLSSHSTLQQIYSEIIRQSPDQEIWLILWSFEAEAIMAIDPTQKALSTDEEDTAHIQEVLRKEITEQQQVNFTEAALIRYFQPEFNTIFKDSFPNPSHKTYSECYDLDINALFVSINTYDIFCPLWSPSVPVNWEHLPSYLLHSRSERKIFLDHLGDDYFNNFDEMA